MKKLFLPLLAMLLSANMALAQDAEKATSNGHTAATSGLISRKATSTTGQPADRTPSTD